MNVVEKTFDPLTGLWTSVGFQDEKLIIKYQKDVAPSLDYTNALRNAPEYAKRGIKQNWYHMAHIDDAIILKMKSEDGFDCTTAHPREIIQFLKSHKEKYGYLLIGK